MGKRGLRRHLLVYDADCGPCTRFKRSVESLDTFHRFDFMPLVQADDEGLLDWVPAELRHKSFHLISPAGEPQSGAEAIPTLVSLLPSGTLFSRLIVSAPGGLGATGFVYAIFSRLHDTGSCGYKAGPGQGHAHAMTTGVRPLLNDAGLASSDSVKICLFAHHSTGGVHRAGC
jgi:predicted DCC family thiol-disulfide oxidoreductase YuxK